MTDDSTPASTRPHLVRPTNEAEATTDRPGTISRRTVLGAAAVGWARAPGGSAPPAWARPAALGLATRPTCGSAGAERDRPHRRGHDGEPLLRPHAGLAARSERRPGRASPSPTTAACPTDLAPRHLPGPPVRRSRPLLRGRADRVEPRAVRRLAARRGPTTCSRSGTTPATTSPSTASWRRTGSTCDAFHASIMVPTFPNRLYMHTAQTDRISNTATLSALPTIWEQMQLERRTT